MKTQKKNVSGVFVFLLLGIFAIVSVLMVLLSAGAYRGTVERTEANNATRVLNAFVRSTLMTDDEEGLFEIREEDGIQTLCVLTDGGSTIKRLYCWDGALRELYTFSDSEFAKEDGEIICEAAALWAEWADGQLHLTLTATDGQESMVRFAPRTEQSGL